MSGENLPKRRSSRVKKSPVKLRFEEEEEEKDDDDEDKDNNDGVDNKRKINKKMPIDRGYVEEESSSEDEKRRAIDDDSDNIFVTDKPKPLELYDDKEDISGADIYSFPTPSKRGAMAEKASINKRSDSRLKGEKKDEEEDEEEEEKFVQPIKRRSRRKSNVPVSELPVMIIGSRRKPVVVPKKNTGSTTSESESKSESESVSEDEDAYVLPSDEDKSDTEISGSGSDNEAEVSTAEKENRSATDSDNDTEEKETIKKSPVKDISSIRPRRSTRINYKDYHLKTDEYFEMQSSKTLTSNRTLGRLTNPRLDEEKLRLLLNKQRHVTKEHKKSVQTILEDYKTLYPMWYYAMEEGYSLLLYGLGSKRNIIEDFRKEILSDHPTLVVNGFFPGLTIKEILNGVIVDLLGLEHPPNQNQCLNLIEQILKDNPDDRLYLIINNIDGLMLRSSKAQDVISQLASIPNLSLIASIDHINAPLIWDSVKHSRYNFCWWDVTTFLPYDVEISFQSSVMVKTNETLAFSSLVNVFLSLTSKARAIYIILVKDQIEHANDKTYPGMAFKDLYRNAREAFLGNSDVTLRTHLKEFLDHKLVRLKRNIDGAEYLNIPLDNSLLKQFLEQYENTE